MTRFRDLLKPDTTTTPMEEQRRASAHLADAVSASNLRWWPGRDCPPPQGRWLLVAVGPLLAI